MKRLGLSVLAVAFLVSCGYAQQAIATKETSAVKQESKIVVGKVASVMLGDAAKAVKSEIVIAEEKGGMLSLSVAATAVIHDASLKVTSLDKIVKDEKVQVKYHDANGVKEAVSITVIK